MNWILFALLAPLLYSISVFIDRFMVSRYFRSSSGALVIYTGLIGVPVFILIGIFYPQVFQIPFTAALIILLNSFLIIGYLFPYYSAIKKIDPSSLVPLFQLIPVCNFILAFFILKETLTLTQIGAASLIILGALLISLNFIRKIDIKSNILGLMLLAVLMISLNATVFKFFALDYDFATATFWQYAGFFVFVLGLIIFSKKYRKDLVDSFRKNKIAIITLNAANELINLSASIILGYAALYAPLALISAVNGIGPVFVFLIGLFLTIFFPKIIKEDLSRKTILQKIIAIILIFIGGYLLNQSLGAGAW